jgi:hypothetical protein
MMQTSCMSREWILVGHINIGIEHYKKQTNVPRARWQAEKHKDASLAEEHKRVLLCFSRGAFLADVYKLYTSVFKLKNIFWDINIGAEEHKKIDEWMSFFYSGVLVDDVSELPKLLNLCPSDILGDHVVFVIWTANVDVSL